MNSITPDDDELEAYVTKQMESYYGKDFIRNAENVPPPPSPAKRQSRGISFAVITCAAVFLTGAALFTGALFSGNIPTSGYVTVSSAEASSNIYTESSESASSENTSEDSKPDSIEHNFENSESASSENAYGDTKPDSSEHNFESSESASSENTYGNSIPDSNQNIVEDSTTVSEYYADTASESSSKNRGSYSLPSIDENTSYVIESDSNNNSITNPYDNVTTGKKTRAGLGLFLMLASLGCAVALYNSYTDKVDLK